MYTHILYRQREILVENILGPIFRTIMDERTTVILISFKFSHTCMANTKTAIQSIRKRGLHVDSCIGTRWI